MSDTEPEMSDDKKIALLKKELKDEANRCLNAVLRMNPDEHNKAVFIISAYLQDFDNDHYIGNAMNWINNFLEQYESNRRSKTQLAMNCQFIFGSVDTVYCATPAHNIHSVPTDELVVGDLGLEVKTLCSADSEDWSIETRGWNAKTDLNKPIICDRYFSRFISGVAKKNEPVKVQSYLVTSETCDTSITPSQLKDEYFKRSKKFIHRNDPPSNSDDESEELIFGDDFDFNI